jgi:hypothetical protein
VDVAPNKPPAYQLVIPSYSFIEMKNAMFLQADRGDEAYIENIQSIENFLAKYHFITKTSKGK